MRGRKRRQWESGSKGMADYYLLNKDTPILKFNPAFGIILEQYSDKLPYSFTNVESWIKSRLRFTCISKQRKEELFATIGIGRSESLIEHTHCISLTDAFWIKQEDDKKKWADVSPFRNSNYSQLISTYALEQYIIDSKEKEESYYNPVFSTRGTFPHAWRFNNENDITFIKAGSKYTIGGSNSSREPYSEYFASQIAQYLGFNGVKYSLRNHKRQDNRVEAVTECQCFTTERIGSVSAKDIGLDTYEDVIKFCMGLGESSIETCLDMFFLDCLTLNFDRHLQNIEFLINNETLEIIEMAPIFDNNNSLLPRFIEGIDTFNREDYITREGISFEELFELICKYTDYRRLRDLLSKLRDFKFELKDSDSKGVSIKPGRLGFLNSFLQERVRYLEKLLKA